jgi:long-chain-fatty-acyl-CoA reductase
MTEVIQLPIIVCGKLRHPDGDDVIQVAYTNGITVQLPSLRDEDIRRIMENRELLHNLSLAEVSQYISNAGRKWADEQYAPRRQAIDLAAKISGYSSAMLNRDYWVIGDYLSFRNNFYDLLDAELGDHRMLEKWVVRQVARVRAFPRGRALHVMVGNVPMAGIYSIVRSLLTRNHTIVKLPSRDMVTCTYFVKTLIEENEPDHPLSRALTVAYWEKDSGIWNTMISGSDLVCAWGQNSSLEAIKRKIPQGTPYLEFGPKRSFSVVYADECDADKVAMRIVHDIAVYDQEACFSPQRVFVMGDHTKLIGPLQKWFEHHQGFLPKGQSSPDVDSHLFRTHMEARYRGWEVTGNNTGWSIIIPHDAYTRTEHPLSRTLFVHPIKSEDEILPFVDDDTQTVALFPLEKHAEKMANLLCARGASRICEVGLVSHFRQGFTHDGGYPLQQFVRLAYIDAELDFVYKYGDKPSPGQLEAFLFGTAKGGKWV